MQPLYQLTADLRRLQEYAADPEQDPESLAEALAALGGQIEQKAVGVAAVADAARQQAAYARSKAAEAIAYAQALERKVERLEDYLLTQLQAAGITAVDDPLYPVRLAASTFADITAPEDLPVDCRRTIIKDDLDRAKILKRLRAGHDVPGARLGRRERVVIGRRREPP